MKHWLVLLGLIELASASSSYTPPPRIPPPPVAQSLEDLKDTFYKMERPGVSIHEISLNGDIILIKGNFSNKSQLDHFKNKIKGDKSSLERKVDCKIDNKIYAGQISNTFEIEVENKW